MGAMPGQHYVLVQLPFISRGLAWGNLTRDLTRNLTRDLTLGSLALSLVMANKSDN